MSTSDPPRLHLDQHISHRIAEQLRNRGFDVTSSQELRMGRASDEEQLAYAVAQQRAILTADYGDYSKLHSAYLAAGQTHCSIILTEQYSIGTMINYLLRLFYTLTAEDLKNQLIWLNNFPIP